MYILRQFDILKFLLDFKINCKSKIFYLQSTYDESISSHSSPFVISSAVVESALLGCNVVCI